MAHCEEYIQLISAAVDGALSPQEEARLTSHLVNCPECRALLSDLQTLHAQLSDLPPVQPPEGLSQRVMEAVEADRKVIPLPQTGWKKAPGRRQSWLAAAAVLALVLAGTWSVKPWEHTTADRVPQTADISAGAGIEETGDAQTEAAVQAETAAETDTVAETDNGIATIKSTRSAASPVPEGEAFDPSAPKEDLSDTYSGAYEMKRALGGEEFQVQAVNDALSEGGEASASPTHVPVTMDIGEEGGLTFSVTGTAPEQAALALEGADLTPGEALKLLLEAYPMPENAVLVDTGERLAMETPLAPAEGGTDPNAPQVSTRLEYEGLAPNGKYHQFRLHTFLLEDPAQNLSRSNTVNSFAVPLEGGEILAERPPEVETMDAEASQAALDAYRQAISE